MGFLFFFSGALMIVEIAAGETFPSRPGGRNHEASGRKCNRKFPHFAKMRRFGLRGFGNTGRGRVEKLDKSDVTNRWA
jgi:hypothetical protein